MRSLLALALLLVWTTGWAAPRLPLPPRPAGAPTGSALAVELDNLSLDAREERLRSEILSGNVPQGLRTFVPVTVRSAGMDLTLYVLPDYLAAGSDDDYLLLPLSPRMAQDIAEKLESQLPTPRIVDLVYSNAAIRLTPKPMPPDTNMTRVSRFMEHTLQVRKQLGELGINRMPGRLTAGHKKDVVVSSRLRDVSGRVAIYGWHKPDFTPIQPLYIGHAETWVDYSQCVRLVHNKVRLNGEERGLADVLRTSTAAMLSDEGPLEGSLYGSTSNDVTSFFTLKDGVRILLNSPGTSERSKSNLLVIYALPNGNTLEETFGGHGSQGPNWRYGIQHIGAQIRFVRTRLTNENVHLACLENSLKSWPAWRRKFGNQGIGAVITSIADRVRADNWVLGGHSGGGSLIFGYIEALATIPRHVQRLVFLDANYAYDTRHAQKIQEWLQDDPRHRLIVTAYEDHVALLDGKPFVSASGGTWGRSHAMLTDMATHWQITTNRSTVPWTLEALDGRACLLLIPNPDRQILHTLQVERNGLIHGLLQGTAAENDGYSYWGSKAYSDRIR